MKKILKTTRSVTLFCIILFLISCFALKYLPSRAVTPAYFMDTQVKFIVYPDGTVGLATRYNYTSETPSMSPRLYLTTEIAKSGNMHNASINATISVPPQESSKFPYNATTASGHSEYSNGILSGDINASTIFPSQTYVDSTMLVFSSFPFNSTDFTVNGAYSDKTFNGTVTIHTMPGIALGDVGVDFEGNTSEITFSGSITVFYNVSLPIPGFTPLNETYLHSELQKYNSTIPGQGPGSLYNMTGGLLTCTTFNTSVTSITGGAQVSFLVVVEGDLIKAIADLFSGKMPSLPYMGVPIYPQPNATTIYQLVNATVYSLRDAEFTMSYSRIAKKLDLQAAYSYRLKEFWNSTKQIISGLYPQQMQLYIESMFNTTYCSLSSYTSSFSYGSGQMEYTGSYVVEGDLNAQANYVKDAYVEMLNASVPMAEWVMDTMKETGVDISSMQLTQNTTEYSVFFDLEGIKISPPVDHLNATCFRLEKLFNFTSSPYGEPPMQNQRLKLIVQGGSNGTHTVTLFIDPTDPERVPDPDEYAGENTMIWNNQSISKLKRLVFRIFEGYAQTIHDPSSITQNNPITVDAKETARCALTFTNISKPATIIVKNITLPIGVSPPPGTFKALGGYVQITTDTEDVTGNVTIKMYYTTEQLAALGLDENSLKIMYWDEEANNWVTAETQANTAEHYVWTTVTHFSIWALMGQTYQALWQQPWFIAAMAIIIVAIIIGIGVIFTRRKK